MVSGCDFGRWGLCPDTSISVVGAVRVPVAPTAGASLPYLCLVPGWHSVRCDACDVCMVSWLDACTAAWLGMGVGGLPSVARVALLAFVGGLTFILRVCLWWFPALVPACSCIPSHRVSL